MKIKICLLSLFLFIYMNHAMEVDNNQEDKNVILSIKAAFANYFYQLLLTKLSHLHIIKIKDPRGSAVSFEKFINEDSVLYINKVKNADGGIKFFSVGANESEGKSIWKRIKKSYQNQQVLLKALDEKE